MRKFVFRMLTVLSAAVACACGDQSRVSQVAGSGIAPGEHPAKRDTPRNARASGQDSAAIERYLARRKYRLDKVAARREGYYAVIATEVDGQARFLLPLRVQGDSVAPLHEPMPIEEYDPQHVEWQALQSSTVDALLITDDLPAEGWVGTSMYRLDSKLSLAYTDEDYTCRPAEMRDVDGDGKPELISYVEDPSQGDCVSECHIDLEDQFDLEPAWVRIHRWTGRQWEPAERQFPSFYRSLADQYEQVDRWLANDPGGEVCRSMHWLQGKGLFKNWAERARGIPSGKS